MAKAIGRNSSGPAVQQVQKMLNKSGMLKAKLKEDGSFGPTTEKAVQEFQKVSQLKSDGEIGPKTLASLSKSGKQKGTEKKVAAVGGIKPRKLNDKQMEQVEALRGTTTGLKAMKTDTAKATKAADDLDKLLKQFDKQLQSVGDDAQLANIDLQNMLQKQQQTLQMISSVSKMLHDTSMSIVRKIG